MTNIYLKNHNLLFQLSASHVCGCMIEQLGESFLLLVNRLLTKSNLRNYPKQVRDELMSNAMCDLVESWHKFDFDISNNPFSYFTQVAINSFKKTINVEKAHLNFVTFMTSIADDKDINQYKKYMTRYNMENYVNTKDTADDAVCDDDVV